MTADKSAAAWHPGDADEFGPGECRGDDKCPAPRHVHGCFTPHHANECDAPNEFGHLPGDGPVKPLDLDAIQARADAATPGPWQINRSENCIVREADGLPLIADIWVADVDVEHENTEFIANAREDVPALLAALAAETARAEQAEQRIADAPHDRDRCALMDRNPAPMCTCWKSAAPTTGEEASE